MILSLLSLSAPIKSPPTKARVAFILKPEDRRTITSPLSVAPLDRARDMLVLAQMGNKASIRAWNDYAQEDPTGARLVRKWVASENREKAHATAMADEFLATQEAISKGASGTVTKSKTPYATCLKCGGEMKKRHARCKGCGAKNPCYLPEDRVKKRKKAALKASGVPVLTKAQHRAALSKAAGRPVRSEAEALRAVLASFLDDADPGTRFAAQDALARL
jgi:hypothetical protein